MHQLITSRRGVRLRRVWGVILTQILKIDYVMQSNITLLAPMVVYANKYLGVLRYDQEFNK